MHFFRNSPCTTFSNTILEAQLAAASVGGPMAIVLLAMYWNNYFPYTYIYVCVITILSRTSLCIDPEDLRNGICIDPEFLHRLCLLFPYQVMKTVRLSLSLAEQILVHPKVILPSVLQVILQKNQWIIVPVNV